MQTTTMKTLSIAVLGGLIAAVATASDAAAQDSKGKRTAAPTQSPVRRKNVQLPVKPLVRDFRADYAYRHRRYTVKAAPVTSGTPFVKTVRIESVGDRVVRVRLPQRSIGTKPTFGLYQLGKLRARDVNRFVGQNVRVRVRLDGRTMTLLELNVPEKR